jgi:hypothetical protein
MCTAVLSIEPGAPLLLAGIRDELVDRAWQPPGRYWPDYPSLIGGRDLLAGGTWLAVAPAARRVACVLNGRGRPAPARARRSRGALPLQAAATGQLPLADLAAFDPFHLLSAEPGRAVLWSWDGERRRERELTAGLYIVVNSGLDSELADSTGPPGAGPGSGPPTASGPGSGSGPPKSGRTAAATAGGPGSGSGPPKSGRPTARPQAAPGRRTGGNAHELARIGHFAPRLRAARRPDPRPGSSVSKAWGAWLPLLNGDGIGPRDPRALIVRRDLGAGRIWGTTSISLVALSPDGLRYDFNAAPGDPEAWYPVPVAR